MIQRKAAGSTSGATRSRTPLGRMISTADHTPFALGATLTRTIWGGSMGGRSGWTRSSRRQVNNCPG